MSSSSDEVSSLYIAPLVAFRLPFDVGADGCAPFIILAFVLSIGPFRIDIAGFASPLTLGFEENAIFG